MSNLPKSVTKKKLILSLTFIFLIASKGHTQSCGTHIPPGFFKKTMAMALVPDTTYNIPHAILPDVNLSLSVYSSEMEIDSNMLAGAVSALNSAFKPAGISFTVCLNTVIEGDEFKTINNTMNEGRLTSLYSTINTINLYFTDTLVADGDLVCGYTYLPSPVHKDYIFIKKDCDIANTLIHEMGHFFGLLHTHETAGGQELVDESNCAVAGDLVCDTKASPDLSGLVNSDCEYTASYKDPHGDYYLPSVSNYMSYSLPECRCRFTPGQYRRMVEYYWSSRTYLH